MNASPEQEDPRDGLTRRSPAAYMEQARREALAAFDEGEVPVGAIIVGPTGAVIGRGRNAVERLRDPTAHAEILAIGAAAQQLQSWRLNGCIMYVTLEPCLMCMGAICAARLDSLVYGTPDPRLGAVDSHPCREQLSATYRRCPSFSSGLLEQECADLLKSFFKAVRARKE
jgi:tRNA(adenine34) deaminase